MSDLQADLSKSCLSLQENRSLSNKLCIQTKPDEMTLQNLPIAILEEILCYFSYGFCLSLRTLSTSFYDAVSRKFIVGYRNLFVRIRKQLQRIESQIEELATCMRELSDGKEIIGLIMHHTVLKILESEAVILKAICHRYIEKRKWNFTTSCGAGLLDHFHNIITFLVVDNLDTTHLDPNITSELMFLCGQFIDHFMCGIEPTLDLVVPFEVKLADILDSCNDASVNYKFYNWDIGYRLNINYYLKHLASLQFPWDVFKDISTEEKLKSILKTMKNNIRYRNYCYPLREAWLVEDIFDARGIDGLKAFLNDPKHYHLRDNQELPCNKMHNWIEWQIGEDGWTMTYDEIQYQKPYSSDTHMMEFEFQIEGGPKPLKFQDLEGEREEEKGICDIHLYVHHPSKCVNCVHMSCIRIEGKNGVYSIQANDHHQH